MKNGDISNEVSPRLLVEFEGLLGHLPASRMHVTLARKFGRWKQAAALWEIDDLAVKVLWDLTTRYGQTIEVITNQGPDFAAALADRFDTEQVPASRVWDYEPRALARRVLSMPYVAAIYTPEHQHAMLYGTRGRLITPVTLTQMGRF